MTITDIYKQLKKVMYKTKKAKHVVNSFLNMFLAISMVFMPLPMTQSVYADSVSSATSNCSSIETSIKVGDSIEWTADLNGSGDTVSFNWTGTDGLSGSSQIVSKTYNTGNQGDNITVQAHVSVTAVGEGGTVTECTGVSFVVTEAPEKENTPPTITVGENPYFIELGTDSYIDQGTTAFDEEDGDLTDEIVIDDDNVNTQEIGEYVVNYSVTDSNGETVNASRVVVVMPSILDTNKAPEIELVGSTVTMTEGEVYVDPGYSAIDAEDGDITDKVIVDTDALKTEIPGQYRITYNVVDSKNKSSEEKIRIIVVRAIGDCDVPVITSSLDDVIMNEDESFEYVITADNADDAVFSVTNLPDTLSFDDQTNTIEGTLVSSDDMYELIINVSTSCGNDQETLLVAVNPAVMSNPGIPTIQLLGDDPHTVLVGSNYEDLDPGAEANDPEDGDITHRIVADYSNLPILGNLLMGLGIFRVQYDVSDIDGNTASTERYIEIVSGISECTEEINVLAGQTVTWSTPLLNNATYIWEGDNDLSGNTHEISHSYNEAGTYSATVKVSTVDIAATCEISTVISDCTLSNITSSLEVSETVNESFEYTITADNADNAQLSVDNLPEGLTFDTDTGIISGIVTSVGEFSITLNVETDCGITQETLVLTITESNICPAPELTSGTSLNYDKGQNVSYTFGYTPEEGISISIDETKLVPGLSFNDDGNGVYSIEGTVSNSAGGDYKIPVTLTSDCGEIKTEIVMTVATGGGGGSGGGGGGGGNSAPVINLIGENPHNIIVGTDYVELGATANDREDGDLTDKIVIDSDSVDTQVIGEYRVTYNVKDRSKRAAQEKVRVVNVVAGGVVVPTDTKAEPEVCHYLRDYLRIDFNNDPEEVIKLQSYLNNFEGENLEVNGIFDEATDAAVKRYQDTYAGEILEPWGEEDASGYVYITTQKHINETYCKVAFPLTDLEQNEIDQYKTLLESLESEGVTDGGLVDPLDVGNTLDDFVNDGVIGLNADNSSTGNVIEVTPEEILGDENEVLEEENTGNEVLGNLAAVLFATPEGFNETASCIGWFVLTLVIIYIIGTILVNNFSKTDNISSRIMRMRKIAVYIIGLVYALIPALITNTYCLVLPIVITTALLSLGFIYIWKKERNLRKTLGVF